MPRQAKRRKAWPCREGDDWCPPSCSIVGFGMGTLHSCSDKLARWNCLGLQGSLLMTLVEDPMYMTTLTIGRKFSRATCQRAVCCRAEGYDAGVDKFAVNHPVLMETNVYMDESGVFLLRPPLLPCLNLIILVTLTRQARMTCQVSNQLAGMLHLILAFVIFGGLPRMLPSVSMEQLGSSLRSILVTASRAKPTTANRHRNVARIR